MDVSNFVPSPNETLLFAENMYSHMLSERLDIQQFYYNVRPRGCVLLFREEIAQAIYFWCRRYQDEFLENMKIKYIDFTRDLQSFQRYSCEIAEYVRENTDNMFISLLKVSAMLLELGAFCYNIGEPGFLDCIPLYWAGIFDSFYKEDFNQRNGWQELYNRSLFWSERFKEENFDPKCLSARDDEVKQRARADGRNIGGDEFTPQRLHRINMMMRNLIWEKKECIEELDAALQDSIAVFSRTRGELVDAATLDTISAMNDKLKRILLKLQEIKSKETALNRIIDAYYLSKMSVTSYPSVQNEAEFAVSFGDHSLTLFEDKAVQAALRPVEPIVAFTERPKVEPLEAEGREKFPKMEPLDMEGREKLPKMEFVEAGGREKLSKVKPLEAEGREKLSKVEPLESEGRETLTKVEPLEAEDQEKLPNVRARIDEKMLLLDLEFDRMSLVHPDSDRTPPPSAKPEKEFPECSNTEKLEKSKKAQGGQSVAKGLPRGVQRTSLKRKSRDYYHLKLRK